MFQSKQRRTYLTNQICFKFGAAKSKLVDVASPVAAPDATPPAAVRLTFLPPRVEESCLIAGDATLECQQCVPLVRQTARAPSGVTTSGWLGLLLLCMRREEEAAGDDEQNEHDYSWAKHGGKLATGNGRRCDYVQLPVGIALLKGMVARSTARSVLVCYLGRCGRMWLVQRVAGQSRKC